MNRKSKAGEIYKKEFTGELAMRLAEEALDRCPVDEQALVDLKVTPLLSETSRLFFKAGIEAGLKNAG